MIRLARTTERLQAVLAGAVTANQLQCTVGFFDLIASTGQFITLETVRGGRKNQTTNNTTDVNICDGPAAQGTLRSIDYVKIYNADTAAATVIVKTDDATTESIHIRATLATLETLYYEDKEGWYSTDANGARKTSTVGDITGSWTPTDTSGAGLSLTVVADGCYYIKSGQKVFAFFDVTYPVTADGSTAQFGGLPFTSATGTNRVGGGYIAVQNVTTSFLTLAVAPNANTAQFFISGTARTNAQMSAAFVRGCFIYKSAT